MAWADLTDVRCYYEIRGEGEPLLLIPGLGGNCRSWDPALPQLAGHFTLILFDNRGMGRSVAKRPARDLAHLSSDIIELLDFLQLDRAHVMGISLGGIIGVRLAIDHPSRIDRLALVSCTDQFSPYLRQIATLLGHALRHFPPETFLRTVELLGTAPEYLDAHMADIERRVTLRCAEGFSRRALADQLRCLACSDRNIEEGPITNPTLVLAGEHDALIPNCYARRMASRIRGSEFEIIQGAGHNPFAECPERIVPRLVRFFTSGRGMPVADSAMEGSDLLSAGGVGSS
jgi:pimeloyl-ACP methyl ester carboxylesterase